MKKEELKKSFDRIEPDEATVKRMLDNVLNHSISGKEKANMTFNFRKAIPVMTLAIIIAGSLLTYNLIPKDEKIQLQPGDKLTEDNDFREDAIAPLINEFKMAERQYVLLSDDLKDSFGLPSEIKEADIGKKLSTITETSDDSIKGSDVYEYLPTGGEAIVAVKMDNNYKLFRFFTFESYNKNQDEDAITYLKLFGINKAGDIAKIQFIGHSEQSKLEGKEDILGEITSVDEIAEFYSLYSVLKNSSDKYFDKLFNFNDSGSKKNNQTGNKSNEIAPDYRGNEGDLPTDVYGIEGSGIQNAEDMPAQVNANDTPLKTDIGDSSVTTVEAGDSIRDIYLNEAGTEDLPAEQPDGMVDKGEGGSGSVDPQQGSAGNALANSITIRIYNQNGVYYDSEYYGNLGFISRYEVSEELADFISSVVE